MEKHWWIRVPSPRDTRTLILDFYLRLGEYDRLQITRIHESSLRKIHEFIRETSKIDVLSCSADLRLSRPDYKHVNKLILFRELYKNSEAFRLYIHKYVNPLDFGEMESYNNIQDESRMRVRAATLAWNWLKIEAPRVIEFVSELHNILQGVTHLTWLKSDFFIFCTKLK